MKLGVVVLFGASLALTACGGGDSETADQVAAYRACERAVESQLKAPATADFAGVTDSNIARQDSNGPDRWTIVSYVDAENSFGANVRTDWSCKVRGGGDDWSLIDLDVS